MKTKVKIVRRGGQRVRVMRRVEGNDEAGLTIQKDRKEEDDRG